MAIITVFEFKWALIRNKRFYLNYNALDLFNLARPLKFIDVHIKIGETIEKLEK